MIRIGIDTGGTYTDAVIVEMSESGSEPRVLAKAKALTTKGNLARGIGNAIDALPREELHRVEQAAISTTLATNACVEGKGGRAKLVLVGSTPEVLRRVDAQGTFGIPYEDVITTEYVGSFDGSEVTTPDWEALYQSNPKFFEEADSFGIASLYALNNGAIVEKSGAEFLRERFGKIVVEATSVAMEPNVIGRGATALLNARLVPVISDFLDAIDAAFAERGVDVPISIVRSDGSLMSEELARIRPVETIMSGPAASITGAQALAGEPECLIVDIGGTTSDISIVHGGRANRTDGIFIGGWKTQVSGVFIDTIALGGDTVVRYTKNSKLELGTRKATPLCIAADRWPKVKRALKWYLEQSPIDFHARYELLYLLRDPGDVSRLRRPEQQLVELLRQGPISLFDDRVGAIVGLKTQRLEDEGIVMRCGMTPTDAMHILGDFGSFDAEASRMGAQCILKSYRGLDASRDEREIEKLAHEIYALAQHRLYGQVIGSFLQDAFWPDDPVSLDEQMKVIVEGSWRQRNDAEPRHFTVKYDVGATLVGVGAPTHVFLGEVGRALDAPYCVPENAEVANAVGAAVSHVSVEQQVRIHPLRGSDGVIQGYQVRSTNSSAMYDTIDEALEAAREQARSEAESEAIRRGAKGSLDCKLSESRVVYSATGVMEIVREWTVAARIG